MKLKFKWPIPLICITMIALIAGILYTFKGSVQTNAPPQDERAADNLKAFAKLYGYIHYFHPSDEATELNWDLFAEYGASQVVNAKDSSELKKKLEELFLPVAPTLQLYLSNESPKEIVKEKGTNLIAWQHYGLGLTNIDDILQTKMGYESKRVVSASTKEIKLFDQTLPAGYTVTKNLNSELSAKIPIVLYTKNNKTLGGTKKTHETFSHLQKKIAREHYDVKTKYLANTMITWNALQHFYPYFDVAKVNWEQELTDTIAGILRAKNQKGYEKTIRMMLVSLEDGHTSASGVRKNNYLPFNMDWVENKLIVTGSESDSVKVGDEILKINGSDALKYVRNVESEISGSKQWKEYKALKEILSSDTYDKKINLDLKRDGKVLKDIRVQYDGQLLDDYNRLQLEPLYEIEKDVYYINQPELSNDKFQENVNKLAKAKGIIFDLRGYANDWDLAKNIIGHLTDTAVKSPIFGMPKVIYPDQEKLEFDTGQWSIEPIAPKFSGKMVYLMDSSAISRPEVFLDIAKYYKLATMVGKNSAGTNGGINSIELIDSQYNIFFTGVRVLKHDGSQHHLIGILPDITIERTIAGVKAGKDEYILKALEVIDAK